jgi:hypothetical protein
MLARELLGGLCGTHWVEVTRGSSRSAPVTAALTLRLRCSLLSDPRPGLEVLCPSFSVWRTHRGAPDPESTVKSPTGYR